VPTTLTAIFHVTPDLAYGPPNRWWKFFGKENNFYPVGSIAATFMQQAEQKVH